MDIVVGGLIEKDGKFLLVQENKEKCRGKWNIPAGRLNDNETIFEGAKREILEESGCIVEPNGILQIANKVSINKTFISIIFSTKLLVDEIKFDLKEILDVKWFSYEEILAMKEELRSPDLIIDVIEKYIKGNIYNLDVIKISN